MVDRDGVSVAAAMRSVGLDPDAVDEARIDPAAYCGHLELHIEQGPELETAGISVGVVERIAAPHDLRVTVTGMARHAGSTPMGARRDAFTSACEIALAVEALARGSRSGTTVGTVGVVRVEPGAVNVIPGRVTIDIDIRDSDLAARTDVVNGLLTTAELRGVTPHTCRHTFASILIDQGATVEFVSDQLGHATTKTTWDIYVHLFRRREHAETARQELNAAFGPMLRSVGHDGDVK